MRDKKLFIEAKNPFLILEKSLLRAPAVHARFEPGKFLANKGKRELVGSLRPTGLALLDDFRTFDWAEEYKYPTVILAQMNQLLAECREDQPVSAP